MKALFLRSAVAVVLFYCPMLAAQTNLLENGSFESGDFTGWTVVDAGLGQFSIESGTTTPTSGSPIPAPPDGTYASVSDQDGPGSHILYQDVYIRNDGRPTHLSFLLYWNNQFAAWEDPGSLDYTFGPNQQLRVDIMDPAAPVDDVGAGVLLNILKPSGSDPFIYGYESYEQDLSQFAGQTVRIRFAEVDNLGFFNMAIDDVQVTHYIPVPVDQPLALLLLILGILFVATPSLRKHRLLN